jgi:hypothetical protein
MWGPRRLTTPMGLDGLLQRQILLNKVSTGRRHQTEHVVPLMERRRISPFVEV